eukprot:gene22611-30883_t
MRIEVEAIKLKAEMVTILLEQLNLNVGQRGSSTSSSRMRSGTNSSKTVSRSFK